MDSVDGLLPIGFGLLCIFLINFFVVAKFSFARLRKEHVEDMDILLEKDRDFLLKLYQNPEYFLNTTQFLILFFIFANLIFFLLLYLRSPCHLCSRDFHFLFV